MSKSEIITTIVVIIFVIVCVVGFIFLLISSEEARDEEKNTICKKIGDRQNLTFLFNSYGKCGAGIECLYQCRFVNESGGLVIKNVK